MKIQVSFSISLTRNDQSNKSATTGTSWNRLRKLVKSRSRAICSYCGKYSPHGHLDHVIPLSKGGTDSIDNLVWSCALCNLGKGDYSVEDDDSEIFRFYVLEQDGQEERYGELPIERSALINVCNAVEAGAKRLSSRDLATIPGLSRDKAREFLSALEENNLVMYANGRNHPDGAQWTASGYALSRELLGS